MSNAFYVGGGVVSSTIYKPSAPISRVTLTVDDETYYTAGDDTGAEIVAACPYATQGMVNSLLSALSGKNYQAFYAKGADLDLLAELGDGVTVDGIYSMLAEIGDDGFGYPDIGAPGEDELEDEYPVKGAIEKTIDRNMAKTRSLISKTASEITLRIEDTEGAVSELEVTIDGVTVTDESGTTRIKGSSIETETIEAGSITADKLVLTGAIKWADLSDEVKNNMGEDNPDYIKSTYIDEATIVSPEIYGGYFYATGQGADGGAAYYIYDSATIERGNVTLGDKVGYLSFDTNGAGTASEAAERVFLTTLDGVALKLQSAGAMSLEAAEDIYFSSPLHVAEEIILGTNSYGDEEPSSLAAGQLYFVWEDSINGYKAVIG